MDGNAMDELEHTGEEPGAAEAAVLRSEDDVVE